MPVHIGAPVPRVECLPGRGPSRRIAFRSEPRGRPGGVWVLRVIQWATGNVGRAAIEGNLPHPELELVGACVHSRDKAGRDVGELCGLGPLGVARRGTSTIRPPSRPTASSTRHSSPKPAEVLRILESGKNVVTPLGWLNPCSERRRGGARGRLPGRAASRCTGRASTRAASPSASR